MSEFDGERFGAEMVRLVRAYVDKRLEGEGKALAPVVARYTADAIKPLVKRIAALERRLAKNDGKATKRRGSK